MGKGAQTRRADRQSARQEKKTDIKSGESRKEARENKHETKQGDRTDWQDNGDGIGQSIGDLGIAIGDLSDGLLAQLARAPALHAGGREFESLTVHKMSFPTPLG
jgi:hypothetical protein